MGTGKNILSEALGNLMFSLQQGLAGQASAPGNRGKQAGMAAAFGAPMVLQEMKRKQAAEDADRQLRLQEFQQRQLIGDQGAAGDLIKQLTNQPTAANGVQGPAPTMGSPNPVTLNDPANAIANQAAPPQPEMSGPNQAPTFSHQTVQFPLRGGQSMPVTPPNLADFNAQEALKRAGVRADTIAVNEADNASRAKWAPKAPADIDPLSEGGIAARLKFESLKPQPPKPQTNLTSKTMMLNGKPEDLLTGTDPDNKEMFGKVFLPTAQGLKDVTGQAHAMPKDTSAGEATRFEASYNNRNTELNDVAKPVADGLQRVGRLMDTINNGSPLADSVTAPELMVVMAGGAGSGVRITQSEINSIVGGQSKWESMKAAFNQWNLDPVKANKILEPMRDQIKTLVERVNTKLTAKQAVIESARQRLIDSSDPKQHKQIVADARQALAGIDGKAEAAPKVGDTKTFPNGKKGRWDGKGWEPIG